MELIVERRSPKTIGKEKPLMKLVVIVDVLQQQLLVYQAGLWGSPLLYNIFPIFYLYIRSSIYNDNGAGLVLADCYTQQLVSSNAFAILLLPLLFCYSRLIKRTAAARHRYVSHSQKPSRCLSFPSTPKTRTPFSSPPFAAAIVHLR